MRYAGHGVLAEISAATLSGTYQTVATTAYHAKELVFVSTLDGDALVSIGGVQALRIPAITAGETYVTVYLKYDPDLLKAGTVIQAKDGAVAANNGTLSLTTILHNL